MIAPEPQSDSQPATSSVVVSDLDGVTIEAPSDPHLALLWSTAQSKFELRDERLPTTRADWNEVTAEYHRLLGKTAGSLGETVAAIRERCHEVPGGD